jgi:hypothetical protein
VKPKGQTAAMQAQGRAQGDPRRGYWRSVITGTLMRHAVLHGIVDYGTTRASELPKNVASVIVPFCDQLLEDAARGSDTPAFRHSHEQHINRELWNALKAFRTDRVPPLRDEQTALHFQD